MFLLSFVKTDFHICTQILLRFFILPIVCCYVKIVAYYFYKLLFIGGKMNFEEGDIFKKALNSFKTVSYELENKFSSYFVLRDSLDNRYTRLSNLLGTKLEPDTAIKKLRQLNLILFGKVNQIFFDSNNTVYLLRIFKNNPEEITQLENLTDIFSTAIDELNSISSLNDQLKSNIQNKNKEAADNNIDAINSAHKKRLLGITCVIN